MKITLKKISLILIAISLIACEQGSDYTLASKNKANKNGAVSSTSRLASEAGIDIMKKGGNAFDIFFRASLAMCVGICLNSTILVPRKVFTCLLSNHMHS